jgi:hypothetical protein
MNVVPVTLEEFAVDPQLGGFSEASQAQRLVMRLLDGLPPADREQHGIFRRIAGRAWRKDLLVPRRVVSLVMGVSSGKSLIAALFLAHRALFADLSGLRPGQRGLGLLVAPDTRLAAIPLAYARGIVETSALVRAEVEGEPTGDSVRFARGTEIAVLPATIGGRGVRGRRFVGAVAEEVAFFRDRDFVVNDQEIVRAIRPRLMPGAQLVGISTPWRKTGWLYQLWRDEFCRSERALVLQAPTAVMRPDLSERELREEFSDDPAAAATELGAEFLENVSGLFGAGELEEVVDAGVRRRDPIDGFQYAAATDPSGLRNDPWAFTVLGRKGERVVQFTLRSWRPGTAVERVVDEIRAELLRFGLRSVASDQFGSEVTKAHFDRADVALLEMPFTSGAGSPKTLGFRALRELVLGGRIRLVDDGEQTRELQLLEVTRLSGGGERVAAPGRLHDDKACALALAVHVLCAETGADGWLRYAARQVEERRAQEARA